MNTSPVDGEGTPTRRTVLIERGALTNHLHSNSTARRMNVSRTGNGQRGGYLSSPHIGTTTFFLRPTDLSRKTLLGMVSLGVYVSEAMGLHTIDPITGDFSLGTVGSSQTMTVLVANWWHSVRPLSTSARRFCNSHPFSAHTY